MTAIQVFEETVENGCQLARLRLNDKTQYDAKPYYSGGKKKNWVYIDHFTASAVLKVHEALGDENKKKFEALPLSRMVDITWRLVK